MGKDGFVFKKIEKDTRTGEHHTEEDTERHREKPRGDDRGRDWSEASICQGSLLTPAAGGEAWDASSRADQPCAHLDSRLPASGTVRESISVVLRPPVSGTSLWQSQETHTDLSI